MSTLCRLCFRAVVVLLAVASSSAPAADAARKEQGGAAHRLAPEGIALASRLGYFSGIVSVELIRPNLVALTLDGGLVPGSALVGSDATHGLTADALQQPSGFRISSPTDPSYREPVMPANVTRESYEWFNARDMVTSWPIGAAGPLLRHRFYLHVSTPFATGHRYQVVVAGAPADTAHPREITLEYSSRKTITPAIKINQLAYSAAAGARYAYLGWWAGNGGPVDFSDVRHFEVLTVPDDQVALRGRVEARRRDHALSGEHVYQLDLSPLRPGRYRIHLPGFAVSEAFAVGGAPSFERFYHTHRAFLHQRCGQELREPWTAFARPACHTEFWESGEAAGGYSRELNGFGTQRRAPPYEPKPGEAKRTFSGGYHDAADYDTFTTHLIATCYSLVVYEAFPDLFTDGQLNLPESGNGIPDVLDEAVWAIKFPLEHQEPNGGVPQGRVNLCDARHQFFEGGKEAAPLPPFGVIPPTEDSTPMFAAAAAQLSRLLKPYQPALAEQLLTGARRAFDYAAQRGLAGIREDFYTPRTPVALRKDNQGRIRIVDTFQSRLIQAAAELLHTTGDRRYHDYIARHAATPASGENFALHHYAYLATPARLTDPAIRDRFRQHFIHAPNGGAESLARSTEAGAYRMANGDKPNAGWGAAQGINHNPTLICAYLLTGEKRFLTAVAHNADWHQGANPAGISFITSMGHRFPNRPEISWILYQDRSDRELFGNTVMGISIYGFGPPLRTYPAAAKAGAALSWPVWRSWRDVWGAHAEIYSEFTVHQTLAPAAMTYAFLYALDHRAGAIPADAKPAFPLGVRNDLRRTRPPHRPEQ